MLKVFGTYNNLILFQNGDQGVIINKTSFDVQPPAAFSDLQAQHTWVSTDTVSHTYQELASSAFIINASAKNRSYRVPKNVLAEIQAQLSSQTLEDVLTAAARTILSGTITTEQVKELRSSLSSLGDTQTQAWTSRIVTSLVAAGELVPDTKPHPFVEDLNNEPNCKLCGLAKDDPIHTDSPDANKNNSNKFFALFNDENFVDGLYAQDAEDSWWKRDLGSWTKSDQPDAFNLVALDSDAVLSLRSQVDDEMNTPGEYELTISEERLFALAEPELDLTYYDRVFAQVPYVDPALRSANAKKQTRDKNGKFLEVGARLTTPAGDKGTVSQVHDDDNVTVQTDAGDEQTVAASDTEVHDDTPKATLSEPAPDTVPDINARIVSYLNNEQPVTADAAPPVDPAQTTDSSDQTPLYLAEVDPADHQSVLDLLALIPTENGSDVECYKRENSTWTADPDILAALHGNTPPSVVELTDEMVKDVISQIDGTPAAQDATTASGYAEVVCYTLTRDEDGNLTATQSTTPILASGEFPLDVYENLDAMFAAEGGTDRNRGNAERLRRYWSRGGEGGETKIRWSEPGDWTRCTHHLEKYLGERAKGYCANLHKTNDGYWPGQKVDGKNLP